LELSAALLERVHGDRPQRLRQRIFGPKKHRLSRSGAAATLISGRWRTTHAYRVLRVGIFFFRAANRRHCGMRSRGILHCWRRDSRSSNAALVAAESRMEPPQRQKRGGGGGRRSEIEAWGTDAEQRDEYDESETKTQRRCCRRTGIASKRRTGTGKAKRRASEVEHER